ncbi:MAG TPA: FAD-dependent oxidoreductase [Armatimonadota bacterium]
MPEKFDVIVVGAGLAGLAAAYTMAAKGMNVIVVERGDYPGSKNLMGGVLYRQPTAEVFPEFWQDAPLERPIVEQNMWILSGDSVVKAGHRSAQWASAPYQAFSVLRGRFDAWLAQKVTAAGALIVPSTTVVELLRDGRGQAIGVRTNRPDGDLLADIVILADGAVSLLGERMGLHKKWQPNQLALAVKQILAPPGKAEERAKLIEQRFGLNPGEGLTIEMYGTLTKGMVGTAFLYTNKDTISFGIGALLSDYVEFKENPHALLQAAKAHPALAPYLADCESREYAAHLIPEGGYDAIPPLFADGVLVVGDAAQLCNGIHREGSNLAVTSGMLAGETALAAHTRGDFSAGSLSAYDANLRKTFVVKDLLKYRKASRHMEKNRQFFTRYPEMLNEMATEFFTVDSVSKREKQWKLWKMAGSKFKIASDLWGMFKVVK